MKYFSLLFLLFSYCAYSENFSINPGQDDINGVGYYSLLITNSTRSKIIDVALEGNSNSAKIRDKYSLSCPWGKAEGVKVSMTSSTNDGVMLVENIYFFDESLKNILAESYVVFNNDINYISPGLKNNVCARNGNVIAKDSLNNKDYIPNQIVVLQGPFPLDSTKDKFVIFIRGDAGTKVVVDGGDGSKLADSYADMDDSSPSIETVFFMKGRSDTQMVVLVSWGLGKEKGKFYKVYAYDYGGDYELKVNKKLNNDHNLSGYDNKNTAFKFKTAVDIKKYIDSLSKTQ